MIHGNISVETCMIVIVTFSEIMLKQDSQNYQKDVLQDMRYICMSLICHDVRDQTAGFGKS